MKFFKDIIGFFRSVAADERIPERDKKVLLVFIALILSPIDLIPDWIPFFGILDDLVLMAFICDYIFNRLDQNLLLSHWSWGMKSYASVRRIARSIAWLPPNFVREKIWKYKPSIYG